MRPAPQHSHSGVCHAHSKQTGLPCKNLAIRGGRVCRYHGGATPNARAGAQRRLAAMVDPALGVLNHAMGRKKTDLSDAIRAARDVLDRAGHKPADHVEMDVIASTALVDIERLRGMTTEELEVLLPLLRKLAGLAAAETRAALPAARAVEGEEPEGEEES